MVRALRRRGSSSGCWSPWGDEVSSVPGAAAKAVRKSRLSMLVHHTRGSQERQFGYRLSVAVTRALLVGIRKYGCSRRADIRSDVGGGGPGIVVLVRWRSGRRDPA